MPQSFTGMGNARFCPVCNHPERGDIEMALLSISPQRPELTLEVIADAYDIPVDALRAHTLMHVPLVMNYTQESADALVQNFQQKAGITSPATSGDGAASHRDSTEESAVPNITRARLADKINMREGDLLLAAANEYYTTLVVLGKRIKSYAGDRSNETALPNFCTKAVVDLYIGCGSELRQAIKGLNDLNTSINGAHDPGADGLKALAEALTKSSEQAKEN